MSPGRGSGQSRDAQPLRDCVEFAHRLAPGEREVEARLALERLASYSPALDQSASDQRERGGCDRVAAIVECRGRSRSRFPRASLGGVFRSKLAVLRGNTEPVERHRVVAALGVEVGHRERGVGNLVNGGGGGGGGGEGGRGAPPPRRGGPRRPCGPRRPAVFPL